ncbi:hypothetical protein SLS58_002675 [Diplodia intermedia]|uniref:Uncharacterized protein n=1 Tax=Diplodia intermedia TaxID=856260 RepID=A0ABR3TY42_9PEZI
MPKSFRKNNQNSDENDSSSISTSKHCFGLNRLRRAFTAHHKPAMTQGQQDDEEVTIGLHRDYTLASLEGRVERPSNSPSWDALRQWLREGRIETDTPGEAQNTTTTTAAVTATDNNGVTLNRSNAVRRPAPPRDLNNHAAVPATCPSTPRTPTTPLRCDKPLPSRPPPQLPIKRRPVPHASGYYDRALPPTPLRPEFAAGNNRPLPPTPLTPTPPKPVIPPAPSSTSDDNNSSSQQQHCSPPGDSSVVDE